MAMPRVDEATHCNKYDWRRSDQDFSARAPTTQRQPSPCLGRLPRRRNPRKSKPRRGSFEVKLTPFIAASYWRMAITTPDEWEFSDTCRGTFEKPRWKAAPDLFSSLGTDSVPSNQPIMLDLADPATNHGVVPPQSCCLSFLGERCRAESHQ